MGKGLEKCAKWGTEGGKIGETERSMAKKNTD